MHTSTRLLGIADRSWPESKPIEELAIARGFEALVSPTVDGLMARRDALGVVVTKLEPSGSLQTVIETMKQFDDATQFVIRVDASDLQTVTTLGRIPGVHVVSDTDWTEATWFTIFDAHLKQQAPVTETEDAAVAAPQLEFVFVDPRSQHLLALVERLAVTKAAVLLQGPTGTGKEVLAKTLHEMSDRQDKPFIALNCAAMPEHLVEDMLFGHEKGAFTGATRELAGVFEQAEGGTVFLDEIGEMPIQLQAKLLRVLQEKEVVRLGGRQAIELDFRLVAATNKDLKAGIGEKTFREDLYYRISAFKLQVPTLAERRGDIVPLANALASKHGCHTPDFSESALRQLYSYHWPGNVRELDNVIQRAVVFADYGRIEAEHLFFDEPVTRPEPEMSQAMMPQPYESPRALERGLDARGFDARSFERDPMGMQAPRGQDLQSAVRASEYDVIMDAIRSTRTREEAAKMLGISPRTLRYKMAKLRDDATGVSSCA
jgi:two-component system response regulator FlrC